MRVTLSWIAAVVATAAYCSMANAEQARPINVLFLMTDQQHTGALGCVDRAMVKTPNLDRVATGGVRFTNMFCPVPFCTPTRAAIVTGLYPSSLGIGRNVQGRDDPLNLREPRQTYLHQLAAHGYHCHQLGKWHLGDPAELKCFPEARQDAETVSRMLKERRKAAGEAIYDAGPRPGETELRDDIYLRRELVEPYQRWTQEHKKPAYAKDSGLIGRSRIKPEYEYESVLADYCIELLKRHRNEPFSITYSVSPPHAPWTVPAPYYDVYDPDKLPLPATWKDHPAAWAKSQAAQRGQVYGEVGFREYLRCYYAQVTMMDDFMGRILDALDELGLADHTLVVFTSDHGNMLGQHGMMDKTHGTFYDDVMRVPLLMRLPGAIPAGKTCDAFASSVDLAATILDYTGASPLAKTHGRSVRPLVEGKDAGAEAVFGERGGPNRMIRTKEWKLCVLAGGKIELYDLVRDQDETKNVADDPRCAGILRDLAEKLRRHMRQIDDPMLEKLLIPM